MTSGEVADGAKGTPPQTQPWVCLLTLCSGMGFGSQGSKSERAEREGRERGAAYVSSRRGLWGGI